MARWPQELEAATRKSGQKAWKSIEAEMPMRPDVLEQNTCTLAPFDGEPFQALPSDSHYTVRPVQLL